MPRISLFCGVPPVCDRCGEEDATVHVKTFTHGERNLGENCLVRLLESGLRVHSLVPQGTSVDAFIDSLKPFGLGEQK